MRDNKGQFAKGNKGKPKGSKNKTTQIVKNKILAYLNDEGIDDAIKEIKCLEGLYKVKGILELAQYALPKQKAVDMTTTIEDKREDRTLEEVKEELEAIKKLKEEEDNLFNDD